MSNDVGVPPEWASHKLFLLGTETDTINFCDEVNDLFVNEGDCGEGDIYYIVEIRPDPRSPNPNQHPGFRASGEGWA